MDQRNGRRSPEISLCGFMLGVIGRLEAAGRVRTSETYRAALRSFMKFRGGADVPLGLISPEMMEAYEAWLRRRGLVPNSVSFYARILRATYNRAVEQGLTDDRHPFRRVYTGIDRTVKRALPLQSLRRIRSLNLSGMPAMEYARDMFMLSFFLRGMSFIDMAFLRKSDLRRGYLTYRRRKTGQQLVIKWTREMQAVLDRYGGNDTDYLLPIIRTRGLNERAAYRNAGYNINRNLKKIADMAGIDSPLTLYVARHSWATAARSRGIPLSVISEGMGHDSEATTRIYLASLDTAVVDRANSRIIASL